MTSAAHRPHPTAAAVEKPPCRLLEWDGEHFGFPIAQVEGDTLTTEGAEAVDRWCLERGIRCLYFLADADDAETARVAAAHGFRVVDLRVFYGRSLEGIEQLPSPTEGVSVREATEADFAFAKELATRSHRGSRFYYDGGFPRPRCDALYEAFVERGFRDPARGLRIPVVGGEPAGYHVLGPVGPDGVVGAELLAVEERHHGRGVAATLYVDSLRLLAARGAVTYRCPRSVRNVAMARLGERLGLMTESVTVVHHKWYGQAGG